MGCRTNFCIGGGCVPTSTDVSAWMSAFGYSYESSDPLASTYTSFINNAPNGLSAQAAWKALCEASMRSRAVLFCNSSPGDVTVTNEGNLIGSIGSVAIQATSVVGLIAKGSSIAGAVPIIGASIQAAFTAALALIQHHAQAEKAQANALSQLCPYATEAIQKADQAVFTGQATPGQALDFLSSTFATVKSSWATLDHSCNAFCWYDAVLDGIYAASEVLYGYAPAPSPTASTNPDAVASGMPGSIPGGQPTVTAITPSQNVAALPSNNTALYIGLGIAAIAVIALVVNR